MSARSGFRFVAACAALAALACDRPPAGERPGTAAGTPGGAKVATGIGDGAATPGGGRSPGTPAPRTLDPADAPDGMVAVPGGRFRMGCDDALDGPCAEAERPSRLVDVGPFFLDRTEVTVAAYRRCVAAEACTPAVAGDECNWGEPDRDDFPINCVTWHQAAACCRWAGRRLPTEAEWERAARGDDGRPFPWGDAAPDAGGVFRANWGEGLARHLWARDHWEFDAPVGRFPAGAGPYGTLDQAGNVAEWTADAFADPAGTGAAPERVVRGGSFREYARRMKTFARDWHGAGRFYSHVGFRCAADPPAR